MNVSKEIKIVDLLISLYDKIYNYEIEAEKQLHKLKETINLNLIEEKKKIKNYLEYTLKQ